MKQSVVEQHRGGMRLEYPVEKLMHAQKNERSYFLINDELYLFIPANLHRFIPWEMKDITLDVFWKNRAENSSEESSPILVTGIRLNRWIQSNYDTQGESVFERPVNFGMLFLVLTLLYSDYFMTEEEHEKEVKMIVNGKQVPYYTQNAILKKYRCY
ncbi:hypothetical protein MKY37_16535 [Psychrobacillus sp. FSL K6-2836]|uniref:hypothetical protein n=1 Tax=Psychrobacillus sp. FSL K6-2836 TaxID=2921548 RepID=UPI0030F831C3